jgi:hypothetical protein
MISVLLVRITGLTAFELQRTNNFFTDTEYYNLEFIIGNLTELFLVVVIIHSIRWSIEKNLEHNEEVDKRRAASDSTLD